MILPNSAIKTIIIVGFALLVLDKDQNLKRIRIFYVKKIHLMVFNLISLKCYFFIFVFFTIISLVKFRRGREFIIIWYGKLMATYLFLGFVESLFHLKNKDKFYLFIQRLYYYKNLILCFIISIMIIMIVKKIIKKNKLPLYYLKSFQNYYKNLFNKKMNKFLSIFKDYPQDFVFSQYEWDYKQLIGQGGFGKIYKVRNKQKNQFDAIKQLDMKNFDQQFKIQALKSQIEIMEKLNCENVIGLKDSHMGKHYTYLIMELCDMDLRNLINKNNGKLDQKMCVQIFSQLAKGLQKMRKKQYIHRDIKPQNILIKKNVYKLADFGFTRKLKIKKQQYIDEVCGTPLYMAPQLLFNQKYNQKCDIWSLGLMLYEMIFGFNPWPTRHPQIYKNSIKTKPIAFPYDCKIGKNTFDFIKKCLQVQEQKRMNWQQFFNHPLIKQKSPGQLNRFPQINIKFQKVLKSIQQNLLRNNKDVIKHFNRYLERYQNKQLLKKQFEQLLQQIDETITTYESEELFCLIDKNKNGKVSLEEFYQIFCQIDYRPSQDIASRKIQQIIVMANQRNVSLKQLFNLFDTNKSNTIDRKQFEQLIRKISPNMMDFQIQLVWDQFDANGSGHIQKDEFYAQMTRNTYSQYTQNSIKYHRGLRNINCLGQYLKDKGICLKDFFKVCDKNKDNKLSLEQFGNAIKSFNYQISKQEVIEMFQLFDMDKNQFLDIDQLTAMLNKVRLNKQ